MEWISLACAFGATAARARDVPYSCWIDVKVKHSLVHTRWKDDRFNYRLPLLIRMLRSEEAATIDE